MRNFLKTYWKTLLFFVVAGLVGGFFIGLYLLDSYTEDIKKQIIESMDTASIPVDVMLGIVSAMQAAVYGLLLGTIGILLGKKTGLWKDETAITKKPLFITIIVAIITSQIKKEKMDCHVILPKIKGLPKQSMVCCEQRRTIDKQRLLSYCCTLDKETMRKVTRACHKAEEADKESRNW